MVLFGNAEIFKDALVSNPSHMTLLLNSVDAMTQGEVQGSAHHLLPHLGLVVGVPLAVDDDRDS